MPPVAIAADSTHYLPRALADSLGVHQVSLYVGWRGEPERELEMDGFGEFYARLREDPELPTTSQPSIGDFLAVWEPLLQAGSGRRLDPPRGRHLGHLRGGPPGARAARRARPRRARRGDRRRDRLRGHGHARARRLRRRTGRREPAPRLSRACARRAARCASGSAWTRSSTCAAAGASARPRPGWAAR